MIKRKLMTIDDLVKFCREQNFTKFSSEESGYKLAVQVPTTFEIDENVDEAHRGMLKLKFRIFHIGLNRNGSFVSEDAAKDAMPTIKNRPILAAIHQLDDGEWDFESHNFEVVKNEETGEEEIIYIEKQVGSFDESEPFFEYDEELDKTYVCGYGYISEEYTKAADIIRRKNGTKNSCELSIEELSFNAKESYLSLDKFYVAASTLLGSRKDGTEIGEGMLGSRADIADFSEHNNSMFSQNNEKLIEMLEQLNTKLDNLSNFTIQSNAQLKLEEGGNETVKLNELLEKYGKTVEDITFDYENLSDEELEVKFEEVFGEDNADGEGIDPEPTSDGDGDNGEDNVNPEDNGTNGNTADNSDDMSDDSDAEPSVDATLSEDSTDGETSSDSGVDSGVGVDASFEDNISVKPSKYSITMSDGSIKEFELTLDDITYAIFNLVNSTYGEADNTYYYVSVYENNYVIMHDYWNGKSYKQTYSREEDNFALVGDRVEVFANWLTKEEETSLNEMRANYASLVQFKADTENAELHAQREAILYDAKYSILAEKDENNEYKNEAFAKLVSEMDNYSLTDLEKELKSVFADHITNGGQFAYTGETEKTTVTKKLFASSTSKKSSRYGNLLNK